MKLSTLLLLAISNIITFVALLYFCPVPESDIVLVLTLIFFIFSSALPGLSILLIIHLLDPLDSIKQDTEWNLSDK